MWYHLGKYHAELQNKMKQYIAKITHTMSAEPEEILLLTYKNDTQYFMTVLSASTTAHI